MALFPLVHNAHCTNLQLGAVVQAYMSGDVRCFNLLYDSDVDVPIARRDPRWRRAGVSIRRPRNKDLRKLFNVLSYGAIHEVAEPYE